METVRCSIPVLSNVKLLKLKKKTDHFPYGLKRCGYVKKRGNNNKWTVLLFLIFHTVVTQCSLRKIIVGVLIFIHS